MLTDAPIPVPMQIVHSSIDMEFFLGRQPIYDKTLHVCAYELLYRSNRENNAEVLDGSLATSQVLYDAFIEVGFEQLVGPHLAFVNITAEMLRGGSPLSFPSNKVVLEVLEDVPVDDPEILGVLKSLSERGYTIALDDFVYRESADALVNIADIVKLDVQGLGRDALVSHVRRLSSHDVRLLAEKVETGDDFEFCLNLGFDYFQGYFLSRPEVLTGRRVPTNQLAVMQLLSQLQSQSLDVDDLENIIHNDITLSYKLLRYINSAYFSLPRKIESIRQAIVYVGFRALKKWATLMGLLKFSDRPSELLVTAMVRARMCEQLGTALGSGDPDAYFTAGLFSTLEALLQTPMPDILNSLPLSTEISQALLTGDGEIGKVLRCTLAYEAGDWDGARITGLTPADITRAYLNAVTWADEMLSEISAI
jgi:EAL and modified HD-GYP domain-containing signal transduction protein